MADYIPGSEAAKIAWLLHFASWLNGHGVGYGLTHAQVQMMYFRASHVRGLVEAHDAQQAGARAARAAKDAGLGAAEAAARDLAQFLTYNPAMTDEDRLAAGLPARDAQPAPAAYEAVETMQPPLLRLDFSIRRQVTVHWGTNPDNERLNKRPRGVIGCEIQYAVGGVPAEESGWASLGLESDSPVTHHVVINAPTTAAYRARYVGKNLKQGSFSAPVECTVSM